MTKHIARPHKRLITLLGVAITSILTPSGKLISSAIAGAVLVGGVTLHFRQPKPPSAPVVTPASAHSVPSLGATDPFTTIFTSIENEGQKIPLMLAMDTAASRSPSGAGPVNDMPGFGMPVAGISGPGTGARAPGFSPSFRSPPSRSIPESASPTPSLQSVAPSIAKNDPAPLKTKKKNIPCRGQQKKKGLCSTTPGGAAQDNLASASSPAGQGAASPGTGSLPSDPTESKAQPNTPPTGTPSADQKTPPEKLADNSTPGVSNTASEHQDETGPREKPKGKPISGPDHNQKSDPLESLLLESDPFSEIYASEESGLPQTRLFDPEPPLRPAAVPEPSMAGLILLGLASMAFAGRRRKSPANTR